MIPAGQPGGVASPRLDGLIMRDILPLSSTAPSKENCDA